MKIATIARNPENSPNMVENDAAILGCVEQELAAMGHTVTRLDEKEDFCGYDAICHMTRTAATLQKLKRAEEHGCRVINRPTAVENCSRTEQMKLLKQNNIPQPQYQTLNSDAPHDATYPAWIKKGNGWSQKREDVAYVTSPQEAATALKNIGGNAVFCEHIEGDVVKFYGVKERFFTHSYPCAEKTKFGWEKINGAPMHHPFDTEKLRETAFAAAHALKLDIFGGDCIVTPEGNIYIIDINDFPSFSAVRQEAARAIAEIIVEKRLS